MVPGRYACYDTEQRMSEFAQANFLNQLASYTTYFLDQ